MAANKQVYESKRVKMGTAAIVFNVIGYLLVGLVALVCLLPFIMLISGSFSSEQAIRFTGYGLLPKEFTLEAYRIVSPENCPCLRRIYFDYAHRYGPGTFHHHNGSLCYQQERFQIP